MMTTLKELMPERVRALSRPPRRMLRTSRAKLGQVRQAVRGLFGRVRQAFRGLFGRVLRASGLLPLRDDFRLLRRFYRAYTGYCRTGVVPADAPVILPAVYMKTNGRLTNYLAGRLARRLPPVPEPDGGGAMPALSGPELKEALGDLRRDGVHVFRRRLDPAVCDELAAFAARTPCKPYGDNLPGDNPAILFDPLRPVAATYWFNAQTLAESPAVQRLLIDPTFLKVAQGYLGMEPIMNIYTMWWSTAFGRCADSRSAQLFHFDLSRCRFLKVFCYLEDVGEDNGPHVYVRGTHRRKVRPLVTDLRISDEEMFAHYPRDRAVTVTGPRGTVFAADTAGFHKGLPLAAGKRLMFQLEYVCDRFGPSEPMTEINQHFGAAFRACRRRHPRFLCRFAPPPVGATTAALRVV
jgi:hypothetical protein